MNVNFATDCIYLQLWMCSLRRCGPVSVLTGYVSANGHKTRHQSEGIVPCETVCLLSKLHEAKQHVNVKLGMDEMDLTAAERR